jgi:lipopolysaccharide export system protein LptA
MKRFLFILLLAGGRLGAGAQTNAPDENLHILSDHGSFDPIGHRAIYDGHVRVNHPEMKLTSEWLVADLPKPKNPDRHFVATTNVVIDLKATNGMAGVKTEPGKATNGVAAAKDDQIQNWHVTGDRADYKFHLQDTVTNETVTISGHAKAQSEKMTVTGEPLVYDMMTRLFSGTDEEMTINDSALHPGGTNAAAAKTISVPAPH